MCNRARYAGEPDTIFAAANKLFGERPRDNRFDAKELRPKGRAYVIREHDGERAWDVMLWDVLGGQASWPMTNVRNLKLPQWRKLAEKPENRCLVPLTEFCEWTPDKHDLGDGKPPLKGEMWFQVTDQPVFAVAGFWQQTKEGAGFTMVTCDPNELVAPIHPKAMITILEAKDVDTWLRGSYDAVVELQRPYDSSRMTVRGPVFPTRQMER
ncbi:SOS response-associated peptidase family protein [Sphingomonas qomolangmaensis]|uniref:Abasic site processing protein n=1 Tax=Sphingomonas qomolangmaensis TaxID=2918765 RepID=A0ABY5LAQ7_9SPHN|nr:SOS response-associated peptidase family protein [Sphingomonas qomolangmaensis]UUL84050.1 SOS response-associated peptidase family protein [Sphingomonas qomolangmaensis]